MFNVTAEYVKKELLKIAFLLQSNYTEFFDKSSRMKKAIDEMPVKWDLSETYIGPDEEPFADKEEFDELKTSKNPADKELLKELVVKVKRKVEVDEEKGLEEEWSKGTRYSAITIYGKLDNKEKTDIRLKIIFTSGDANWSTVAFKNGNDWDVKKKVKNINQIKEYLWDVVKTESGEKSEKAELKEIYQGVFKRGTLLDLVDILNNTLDTPQPWEVKAKTVPFRAVFTIKDLSSDDKARIIKEMDNKKSKEALSKRINQEIEKLDIDPNHISLRFSSPNSAKGFSIILEHSKEEKHEN